MCFDEFPEIAENETPVRGVAYKVELATGQVRYQNHKVENNRLKSSIFV